MKESGKGGDRWTGQPAWCPCRRCPFYLCDITEVLQMREGHRAKAVSGGLTGHLSLLLRLKYRRRIQFVCPVQTENLFVLHTALNSASAFFFFFFSCVCVTEPDRCLRSCHLPSTLVVSSANTQIGTRVQCTSVCALEAQREAKIHRGSPRERVEAGGSAEICGAEQE